MSDLIESLRRYSYQQGTDDEQGQLIAELVGNMHEAADEIERLRDALTQITYGEGRYNTDQLTHAENTIEDMIGLAEAALEGGKE